MERLSLILDIIWERKSVFMITFFIVFLTLYALLVVVDFVPELPKDKEEVVSVTEISQTVDVTEDVVETIVEPALPVIVESPTLPTQIEIERLGKTIEVLNPSSRTVADLDAALLEGVVRHPDSAKLGQDGNVFILGHSSYLPDVRNKNFQAFNGIQNLEWGDVIKVYTSDSIFEYKVQKVYRAKAQDTTVPVAGEERLLTLATCNSFGAVDDRYIVEAKLTQTKGI